ncbi:MAG TPA: 3'-5' exonuclease, partial [Candidatus Paceibacterota bacterium]|nr:3'-5' exonuclease [Candidatus Paceibacterota bacterium]
MEKLNLVHTKPLAFIKVQTTGLNPEVDRIIELSITRIEPDGKKKTGTRLVNPGMLIPEEATKINGITNEMVKDKPSFKELAENLSKFVEGCDFVGFTINRFDLRFLSEEFNRAEVEFTLLGRKVLDIANIYHTMEPRDLMAANSFYCGQSVSGHISSEKTTEMYLGIINGMMEKYTGKEYTDKEGSVRKVEANIDAL